VAVDAVGLLDRVEGRAVLGENRAPVLDAVVVHQNVEIVPERLRELGLGIEQVHNAQVGGEPREIGIEHRA
jgi:hypothetical protein